MKKLVSILFIPFLMVLSLCSWSSLFSCCCGSIKVKTNVVLPALLPLPITTMAHEVQTINCIRCDVLKHHFIAAPHELTLDVKQDITIKNGKSCTIVGHITNASCYIQARCLRGNGCITTKGDLCIIVKKFTFMGTIKCGGTCSLIVDEPIAPAVLDRLSITSREFQLVIKELKTQIREGSDISPLGLASSAASPSEASLLGV